MEKLSNEVLKKIDELVDIIISSKEYTTYKRIKEQLPNNKEIMNLIKNIKMKQQYLVRNNIKDEQEEKSIEEEIKKLKSIPIYNEYLNSIDNLNNYLQPIKKLQDYFDDLCK